MLYQGDKQTLVEVAVAPLSAARLQELAQLKGKQLPEGFVAQVAIVCIDPELAQAQLPEVRRFGLELRSLGDQGEVVLHEGTRVVAGGAPGGTLLPVLREESWPHVQSVVHRRLLTGNAKTGPWVTFGYDTPKQLGRVGIDELERRAFADLEAEALRNLAARVPQVVEQGGIVELRDEYAPEMLLLPDVMRDVARRLKSDMFVVSVPQEGSLLAVPMTGNPAAVCKLAREKFDGSRHRRISPLPIVVGQGAPVGFVTVTPDAPDAALSEVTQIQSGGLHEAEAEPPKKPWWKFW